MRVEWVASSPALYLRTWCIQHYYHYYRWCAHLGCASSRLNWRLTGRFKWTRPFPWKTKSGFCACAMTFQTCCMKRWLRGNVKDLFGVPSAWEGVDVQRDTSPPAALFLIISINIKDWTLWSVPSPKLQLLSPTFLRSSSCSPSLWSVVVWFQSDLVLWHSLQVLKPL